MVGVVRLGEGVEGSKVFCVVSPLAANDRLVCAEDRVVLLDLGRRGAGCELQCFIVVRCTVDSGLVIAARRGGVEGLWPLLHRPDAQCLPLWAGSEGQASARGERCVHRHPSSRTTFVRSSVVREVLSREDWGW